MAQRLTLVAVEAVLGVAHLIRALVSTALEILKGCALVWRDVAGLGWSSTWTLPLHVPSWKGTRVMQGANLVHASLPHLLLILRRFHLAAQAASFGLRDEAARIFRFSVPLLVLLQAPVGLRAVVGIVPQLVTVETLHLGHVGVPIALFRVTLLATSTLVRGVGWFEGAVAPLRVLALGFLSGLVGLNFYEAGRGVDDPALAIGVPDVTAITVEPLCVWVPF